MPVLPCRCEQEKGEGHTDTRMNEVRWWEKTKLGQWNLNYVTCLHPFPNNIPKCDYQSHAEHFAYVNVMLSLTLTSSLYHKGAS